MRVKLRELKLDNEPVWERERLRAAHPDHAKAPFIIKAAYISLCWCILPSTESSAWQNDEHDVQKTRHDYPGW